MIFFLVVYLHWFPYNYYIFHQKSIVALMEAIGAILAARAWISEEKTTVVIAEVASVGHTAKNRTMDKLKTWMSRPKE